MNVNEYLDQLPPRRDSKLVPYKEELRILYLGKASAAAIRTFLCDSHGLIVSRQAIWEFCTRHFSRDTDAPTSGDRQFSAPRLNPPVVVMSSPNQSEPPSSDRAIRERLEFSRSSGEPTSPVQVSKEQTSARPQVETASAEMKRPALNAGQAMPAFRPVSPEPVSKIDPSETESLIPPGFFGPASQLNPPMTPPPRNTGPCWMPKRKTRTEKGAGRADGPRADKRNLTI
jgi:hypothetical protein